MQLSDSEHDLTDGCLSGQPEGVTSESRFAKGRYWKFACAVCRRRQISFPSLSSSFLCPRSTLSRFLPSPLHPHAQPPSRHLPHRTLSAQMPIPIYRTRKPYFPRPGPEREIAAAGTWDAPFHSILPSHRLSMLITDTSLTPPTPTRHVGVGIQASSRNLSSRSTLHTFRRVLTRYETNHALNSKYRACAKITSVGIPRKWR